MNKKKLLLYFLAVISVLTVLSFSAFAEPIYSTEVGTGIGGESKFELDKHFSVSTSEENSRKEKLPFLFDGDIADGGIYADSNSWWGPEGDHVLITFKEPTVLTKFVFYLTGNWSCSRVEFFDGDGELLLTVDEDGRTVATGNAYGPQAELKTVFNAELLSDSLTVSQIKITTYDNKWDKDYTYKIAEIEMWGIHEHNYTNLINTSKIPTCAESGVAEYGCSCGETAETILPPTGEHTTNTTERVFFRDGFTSTGYLLSSYCDTCANCDVKTETEIGPLFTSLGYSVRETGTLGIQFGVAVNYDNIAKYEELTNTTVEFGITAASRAALKEGNPLDNILGVVATNKAVILRNLTESQYDIFSYSISGFTNAEDEFILCAYLYDGMDIYYIGEGTSSDASTVTYKQFADLLN